jgi:hypothetical protein
MTQYLLSVYHPEITEDAPPPESLPQIMADVDALNQELGGAGAWVFAGGLHPSSTATVVRLQDGEVLTTDGPFVEGKEHIGGFWVIRPVAATATGPAICTNVASATEFAVSGDSNMTLDTPDHPFVLIATDVGDRWRVLRDAPRKDGVLLRIDVSGRLVTDAGKPGTIGMWAAGSSTLTSTFSKTGGSIRFAGLVAQTGPDYTGESLDLAGTLEWTCGGANSVTP